MRADAVTFALKDQAEAKSPRFVAAIIYDVDSMYVTSHAGIENVPGTIIEGALSEPTITSQKLNPDEAAAEIGSASFGLIDLDAQFSTEVRERLSDGAGLRGRQVRFYLGYDGMGFEDFVLVGTQVVDSVAYVDGQYQIQCLDIQRAMRTDIFEIIETTLAASVGVADAIITLTSTAGLQRVVHGTSWTDAPSATVGYVKIRNEIIRYSGISGNQLTGCVRGVFGTAAAPYEVDASVAPDRREQVTEYVYLELPAVKLAYAILTGKLWGSANTFPPGWHLGIAPKLVADADFTGIGSDLWNPADDSAGFVVRFEGLKATDGKRFLEKEIFLLIGTYMPVYADGSLGLRRMIRLSEDAATSLTLDESNSVQVSELRHDMSAVHNAFVVNWSWNGEEFRRATAYIDTRSRATHGVAPTRTMNFKGLFGGRHTDGVIFQMLDMMRDRFAGPPLRLSVQVLHALNRIEVGDVARVRYRNVRDFSNLATPTVEIDRAFEVQNISADHRSGGVTLELFASTADAAVSSPTAAASALPDAYYTSQGTALGSVAGITIVGGHLTAATQPLVGTADLNASASIFYVDGDLTIDAGVALEIRNNVQLRVKGFLQINGTITGKGHGHAGVVDDGRALAFPSTIDSEGPFTTEAIAGTPGYVGTVRGYDGVRTRVALLGTYIMATWPPHMTLSRYAAAPRLLLNVAGNAMTGLPTDLRGAGGGPGGRVGNSTTVPYPVEGRGGPGANGGAGLATISRGVALGANGLIDVSGSDSTATAPVVIAVSGETLERYPGAGGGGGPGTLYVLLDGSSFSLPDFSGGKLRARAGDVPVPGANALPRYRSNIWARSTAVTTGGERVYSPLMGYADPNFGANDAKDYAGSAVVIQHVPGAEVPVSDPGADLPPPITLIQTESIEQGITVTLLLPPIGEFDTVQLYASIDNNRANAAKVAEGMFDIVTVRVPDGAVRYFWARTKRGTLTSPFYPSSATAGVVGSALGGMRSAGAMELYATTAKKKAGSASAWDAAFYSAETYAVGIFVSFQPGATGSELAIGLNSDPETDHHYTSLDYAWLIRADGRLQIYESGTLITTYAAPAWTINSVLEVRYDGQLVRYFRDAALVRSVPLRDGVFFVDSSFYNAGATAKNIKYGPQTTAPSIPWVARGQCEATATTARKNGGTGAWDSDVYSFEGYRNGAFLSFQPDAFLDLMVGFNTDPLADQHYTSIDHAWFPRGDGTADIYESGVNVALALPYTSASVFAIAYDGKAVRYILNGTLVREVPNPDRTFHLDASFFAPGAAVRNLTFTPYGTATPVPFVARGSVTVSDTTAQKSASGAAAWDSDFISINGYARCFVEAKPSQANADIMFGLNSDPYADGSYSSLDGAWYVRQDGQVAIYESNVSVAVLGAYTTSTVLAITYDETDLRYFKDGEVVRTTNLPGRTMYADASFHTPGGALNSLRFGPGTTLMQVDTPQLRPEAATQVVQLVRANFTDSGGTWSGSSSYTLYDPLASLTYTNSTPQPVNVLCDYKGAFATSFADNVAGLRRSVYMRITGGASYSEGDTEFPIGNDVDPNHTVRSGSVIVGVPAGTTVTMELMLRAFYPAGNYSYGTLYIRDVVLNMQGIKR